MLWQSCITNYEHIIARLPLYVKIQSENNLALLTTCGGISKFHGAYTAIRVHGTFALDRDIWASYTQYRNTTDAQYMVTRNYLHGKFSKQYTSKRKRHGV